MEKSVTGGNRAHYKKPFRSVEWRGRKREEVPGGNTWQGITLEGY